ncbi:LSU ribosomal protein L31P [Pseudidiomarina planktonica]|uniref:Large ribosomal subunit protein bL31 n=1 Tax=Pseudidiomarina planktonica TaxID=1323738 RepID=A0A1Y6FY61_9GAMM|nr:50S ribosomal protein L31 [Pseudidiomarina planktonica]RUO63999.1 50S ribosomal protein L31 [Pseudidiomarina planktonica]SMQ79910.1 LSU ribosomal protein L31P [Pseudidiomarina planktonica]
MREGIHPKYEAMNVTCSCGHSFTTNSTRGGDLHLDVCSECHPFYTGKQRVMDTGGRIEKFNKRFSMVGGKK